MDAERWQRLSPLLDALIELEGDARQARLAALREEDPALAAEVEALLALEEDNEDFLAEPLVAPPPMARPDTLIGPYKLDRLLGEGGMGQVFRARDTKLDRDVAIKILPEAFAHDAAPPDPALTPRRRRSGFARFWVSANITPTYPRPLGPRPSDCLRSLAAVSSGRS